MTGPTTRLLPLAITGVDGHEACVGALDETGRWLRPEPVTIAEVTAADPAYRYWHWTEASLGPSTCDDARPEDRALLAPPRPGPPAVPAADRAALLDGHADTDVQAAIGDAHRSLGLVRADVREVYLRRSTGGRTFVRCRFTDGTGAEHDWIVPEIAFAARARELIHSGRSGTDGLAGAGAVYLALGLTKPNDRFPGRFGGCHPLVVGVHPLQAEADR